MTNKGGPALPSRLVHHLVGVAEIADMLSVSKQRVHQLTKQTAFPEPVAVLVAGKVWERAVIEQWARDTGRVHVDEP